MVQSKSCSRLDCLREIVTTLGGEDLCFDHFCTRCYELLEHAERGCSSPRQSAVGCSDLACRLDECARRALEISLSPIALNNLDRAKLLDIVLWSGDLSNLLKRKRSAFKATFGSEEGHQKLLQDAIGNGRMI